MKTNNNTLKWILIAILLFSFLTLLYSQLNRVQEGAQMSDEEKKAKLQEIIEASNNISERINNVIAEKTKESNEMTNKEISDVNSILNGNIHHFLEAQLILLN